jgi:ankyrin repeat protein
LTERDSDRALALLRGGADVNARTVYGVTPLAIAVLNGDATMVEQLLTTGADVEGTFGSGGETALMVAARSGSVEIVRMLLGRGAMTDVRESAFGQTALMYAAVENHGEIVKVLAEAGAELDAVSKTFERPQSRTPKDVAAEGARGSFPRGGFSALLLAARNGAAESVRALVGSGAAIDQPQDDGITPLIMAIFNGHYDVAALLLELGADPGKADEANRTPLYMAVDMHMLEWLFSRPTPKASGRLDAVDIVKRLLALGVDPNPRLTKRPTALGIGGSGINVSLTSGSTPLMKAATTSDVEVMRLLLAAGADPNLTTNDGTTSLMMAAGLNWRDIGSLGSEAASVEAMTILLERGADVDAFNDEGMTALHGAAQRGSLPGIQLLVKHGAKLTVANKRGRTALDEAIGDEGLNGERRQARPEAAKLLSDLIQGQGRTAASIH